jgi:ATP-binding cassette subfamily C (CFTR/MRP) protein 1
MSMMQFARAIAAENFTAAASPAHQFFCHDDEGWGPLSLVRYDFTPCFLDAGISIVSVFGIVFGSITIWWLLNNESRQPTPKDWHYYTKLVSEVITSITH